MTRLLLAGEPRSARLPDQRRLRTWHDSLARAGMVEHGDTFDDSGRLVIVVREQLDQLNSQYCRAVLELETYAGFDSFVADAVATGRQDLSDAARLLDAPDPASGGPGPVAVPWSRLPARAPVAGPVLVGATRLLHKRLTRLGVVRTDAAGTVRQAADALQQRATDQGWDDTTFWGWSSGPAAETIDRFRAGNAAFAKRAWGTDWPDPPPERERTRFDLAGRAPALVSDVLVAVQDAVAAC